MNGLTNATSQDVACLVPKTSDSKMMLLVRRTPPDKPRFTENLSIYLSPHRLQIRHSKILLILARPIPIGYFTFYYFSFFLIFNRNGCVEPSAWRRVYTFCMWQPTRSTSGVGVLLLIPKYPQRIREGSYLSQEYFPDLIQKN